MRTSDLQFDLPADRIATAPAQPRDSARLMVVHRDTGRIQHAHVRDLPSLGVLKPDDLLIFNQSKVIPAHFVAQRSKTKGKVKGLYVESPDPMYPLRWKVMLESRGSLRLGETIMLDPHTRLSLIERLGDGLWLADLHSEHADITTLGTLEKFGNAPLPPYIRQQRRLQQQAEVSAADVESYNTVYARDPGSVAAPTAGLHFTPELLETLWSHGLHCAWVTLHVGVGTFAPVRVDDLRQHTMHSEWVRIPADTIRRAVEARQRGSRLLLVGTTTLRAMESLPEKLTTPSYDFEGHTNLFIHPDEAGQPQPQRFRYTDMLMTNFHLPESTLLALVAALPGVGLTNLKKWYQLAIDEGYRFYSYGDAMLLV